MFILYYVSLELTRFDLALDSNISIRSLFNLTFPSLRTPSQNCLIIRSACRTEGNRRSKFWTWIIGLPDLKTEEQKFYAMKIWNWLLDTVRKYWSWSMFKTYSYCYLQYDMPIEWWGNSGRVFGEMEKSNWTNFWSNISIRSLFNLNFPSLLIPSQNCLINRSACRTEGNRRSKFWTCIIGLPDLKTEEKSFDATEIRNW